MNMDERHSYERTAHMRWAGIDVAMLTFTDTPPVAAMPCWEAILAPWSRDGFPRCGADNGTVGGRHNAATENGSG